MEPKYRVGQGDQLRLERRERIDSRLERHAYPLGRAPRQIQVNPVVARLGIVQTLKEVAQGGADVGRQGSKALARSGLDEGAAYHQIDFAVGFALRDQAAQALGIAAGSQASGR